MARQKWFKEKKGEDGEDVSLFGNLGMKDGKSKQAAKTSKKQGIEQSTVMFVPSTIRSLLLKMLQEKEDEMAALTGFRIKFQEAGGTQLGRMFSQNLARDIPCGRLDCQPCLTSKEGSTKNCRSRSILYESSCLLCNPDKEETETEFGTSNPEGEGDQPSPVGGKMMGTKPDDVESYPSPTTTNKGRVD